MIGEVSVEDLLDLHVQQDLSRLLLHDEMTESWEEEAESVRSDLERQSRALLTETIKVHEVYLQFPPASGGSWMRMSV